MHYMIKNSIFIILITFLLSFVSLATEITVTNARMPEVPPVSRMAAIYLTLENKSKIDYVLVNASTSIARHTMIHQTVEKDGIVKMNHIDGLLIKAKGMIKLNTGGTHIMLMGLTQESIPNPFELTLNFKGLEPKELVSGKIVSGGIESKIHKEQTVLVNIVKR